jgi:arylsulfatase A-like enzyme
MVTYIDDEFGKLMATLSETGLDRKTVVIFTADHGDYMGDHRMIRKGPHVYEALTHVPFIVRTPGHVGGDEARPATARTTDAMVTNIDIFPTVCDLAGVAAPEGIQGRSFAPVLDGEADRHRQAVYTEHGSAGRPLGPGDLTPEDEAALRTDTGHHLCPTIYRGRVKGVRTDRFKYAYTPGDADELYDLHADPAELTNLAGDPEYADVVAEHRRLLLDWEIETEDTLHR